MDHFLHITATWLHVLGIALFVGPQFFLAFAWVPASRRIADLPTRVEAMRTITRRFGYIGGLGLVLIIGSGIYQIMTWRDYYNIGDDLEFTSIRYGVIFIIKMTALIVMLILVGLHTFVVGPKQLSLMEEQAKGGDVLDDEVRSARKQSMMLSIAALVITLAIMVMGVSMGATVYSFQDV
jgi:uncharacterized membrane protein